MNTTTTAPPPPGQGKYLTFKLGAEEYGVGILKVREIVGCPDITPVPQTPAFVRGVINLRGQVIPVVDLRLKFGMGPAARTGATCIIVVESDRGGRKVETGVLVDEVSDVRNIPADQIEPPPEFGPSVSTEFIAGLGKVGGSVKILLDIDAVLGSPNDKGTLP